MPLIVSLLLRINVCMSVHPVRRERSAVAVPMRFTGLSKFDTNHSTRTALLATVLTICAWAWHVDTAEAALEAKQTPQRIELEFWRAIQDSTDAAEFEAYLEAYPEGKFAALAKIRAKKFATESTDSEPMPTPDDNAVNDDATAVSTDVQASEPGGDATVLPTGVYRDCGLCPAIVDVPAGAFDVGGKDAASTTDAAVSVTVSADLSIAREETSVGQWQFCVEQGFCKENPRHEGLAPETPAINLSWNDAIDYIDWLSEYTSFKYRLPTEAEWEYVARAGSETAYWWGDDDAQGKANCCDCEADWNKKTPVATATLLPNKFGLLGSLGGVSEWVQDCWNADSAGTQADAGARLDGDCTQRVLRGGSWRHTKDKITAASRASYDASVRYVTNGFRVIREKGME